MGDNEYGGDEEQEHQEHYEQGEGPGGLRVRGGWTEDLEGEDPAVALVEDLGLQDFFLEVDDLDLEGHKGT